LLAPRTRRLLVLFAILALAVPAASLAATKHGITPLAPKAGALIASGKSPTFRMRVRGHGQVWVHVCKSSKRDRNGVICNTESIGRAKKVNGVFRYTPEFWLNTPGTYYWQAHRIDCTGSDCEQEGPTIKFRVAPVEP
jgi:hypothetical protein